MGRGFIERNRILRDPVRECRPLDEFEDERGDAVGVFESVDGAEVGMIQRREGLGFTLTSCEALRVIRHRGQQHLDGYLAIELRIARALHGAHAALAKRRQDLEGAEARAGRERRGVHGRGDRGA